MLHRCVEEERVGDDGGEVVGVDHCHDDGPGSVPAPPGVRGREPPSFFFFLDLPPPRWEEGFPSGPWRPWRRRGWSPFEIGYISLFLFCFTTLFLAFHRFLNIRRPVTSIGLEF